MPNMIKRPVSQDQWSDKPISKDVSAQGQSFDMIKKPIYQDESITTQDQWFKESNSQYVSTPKHYPIPERVIRGENNLLPVSFLSNGVNVSKSVAFIMMDNGGATGFLVSNDLLLTNNHVFTNKDSSRNAKIIFNFEHDIYGNPTSPDVYLCNPDDFFYTNAELDFTLVRVNKKSRNEMDEMYSSSVFAGISPSSVNPHFENTVVSPGLRWGVIPLISQRKLNFSERINIIQHPGMRRKEISCQDNQISGPIINNAFVRYTTDTEPGSSGAPVCNNRWELIALHHAGVSNEANEGILVSAIVNDLLKSQKGTERGEEILVQLGISGIQELRISGGGSFNTLGGGGSVIIDVKI